MTLRHMKIILAVCENGCNTTKAAEALHMTQPAVSLAIRELEEYYGTVLFDRMGRRLRLSEAGRRFLEYARRICALFDDMERSMRNWDAFGLLRVGASVTIGSQFLPHYVDAFYSRCPGTQVRVVVEPSQQLEEKLLNNQLDLALIEGLVHSRDLVAEEYMEDELIVVCPAGSGYKAGEGLSLREFQKQKLLLRERGSGTREVFDRAAEQAGFSVDPVWEASSYSSLVNAVIAGLGVTVLPKRMALPSVRRGLVVPVFVEGMDFRRRFHIVYHREKLLTAAAKNFLGICRSYEDDYPQPDYNTAW